VLDEVIMLNSFSHVQMDLVLQSDFPIVAIKNSIATNYIPPV
jgi:hypothetical protein